MFQNASDYILTGIKNIFVPSDDFISDKVDALRSRFGIVQSVSDTVAVFGDFFDTVAEGKPPKIEIHLDNADSEYDYGDVAYALDMSWYVRYKPTVDILLSSMLWVFFVWRVFVRLPSIINGVASGVDTAVKIEKGRK